MTQGWNRIAHQYLCLRCNHIRETDVNNSYNKKSSQYMAGLQKWKLIALFGMCAIVPALY